MTAMDQKDRRLNLRISSDALVTIKAAAALSQQDVSAFLLGAAMARARAVLAEDFVLRLSATDFEYMQAELDREPRVIPALVELFEKYETDRTKD